MALKKENVSNVLLSLSWGTDVYFFNNKMFLFFLQGWSPGIYTFSHLQGILVNN